MDSLRNLLALLLGWIPLQAQLPTTELNRQLPRWLAFSGDERMRLEGFSGAGFGPNNDDLYLLSRFRFNLAIKPSASWKILVQTQDARVWWKSQRPYAPPFQDTWDLRQAYLELRDPDKSHVALRIGRQEISLGGERLIGVSSWQNVGRTFDAARLLLHYGKFRLTAFSASVVVLRDGEVGSADAGNNLHALYGTTNNWLIPNSTIEPYLMWRLQPSSGLDMKISGVRWLGTLHALDYNTSLVFERGHDATDQVNAWAGHWLLGYTLGSAHLVGEYNYATGDASPHDGQSNTFLLLYGTAHDRHGLSDEVGWRNLQHVRGTLDVKSLGKWSLTPSYNAFWLADAHDGLYNSQGNVVVPRVVSGSAGRWVGQELDLSAQYNFSTITQVGAGFSHLFPGTFLKLATPGHGFNYPYLQVTTRF